ncbi:MAG: SDR family oxidoreductase [Chloroflexaceae bacterium]|nr:SDR family oxidoreductase [Chloroflexaceae bacterium]
MRLKPIAEQVVAIMGASSGIGREAALEFAQRGAKVAVSARNEFGLKSLVEEIVRAGGEAFFVVADVSDLAQLRQFCDATVARYGRLDTWVNAAANGVLAPFDRIAPEEFERVIAVTLMGQVYGAMAALPHLKQAGGGAMIHISSMEGVRSLPLQSPYSTAKHGLEGFLESLRVELRHEGLPISVTSIKPAVINTPFYNHVLTKLGVKPTGIPPYYDPRLVAQGILHTAEHPTRDYIVGDVGRIIDILQRLSPEIADFLLLQFGFIGQTTDQPKAASDRNNLFEPMEGYTQVDGDFGNYVIPSLSDWFARHPLLQWGTLAAIAGLTGLIISKSRS